MTRFPFCLALVHAVSNPGAFYSTSRLALQTANAKAAVATIGRHDEIDAAFANMVQWRADAAAVIRIVRAISRRTPNADEGHLRLRRRLTEQARCAIKAPGVADGVRRLAGGMARAYRYQAGPNLSSLAARPAERMAYN